MSSREGKQPVRVAIVGAGHRSVHMAKYADKHPNRMKVVAVADPNEVRRNSLGDYHDVPDEMRFESYEDLAARPGLADAVINGTMDQMHYESTMPLLKAGYHVLLEKPICRTAEELHALADAARQKERMLMICHVLRYAPFYRRVRQLVADGELGDIISMRTSENVCYHHFAVGFVRGKWNHRDESNPVMLAKCCHDLDLICWMLSGIEPKRISSFGSLKFFRPEYAPEGSGTRCLVDCDIEPECPYSAKLHFITKGLWGFYVWDGIEHIDKPTLDQKMEYLAKESPHGRCVWKSDNDQVDHQSVIVEFDGGATATHDLFGATARPSRTIHIIGTKGEIDGDFSDGIIKLRKPHLGPRPVYDEQLIDVNIEGTETTGHGGGDEALVHDFVSVLLGEEGTLGVTHIADSVNGHLIGFGAIKSMNEGRVIGIEEV